MAIVGKGVIELEIDDKKLKQDMAKSAKEYEQKLESVRERIKSKLTESAGEIKKIADVSAKAFTVAFGAFSALGIASIKKALEKNTVESMKWKLATDRINSALADVGTKFLKLEIGGRTITGWMNVFADKLRTITSEDLTKALSILKNMAIVVASIQFTSMFIATIDTINKLMSAGRGLSSAFSDMASTGAGAGVGSLIGRAGATAGATAVGAAVGTSRSGGGWGSSRWSSSGMKKSMRPVVNAAKEQGKWVIRAREQARELSFISKKVNKTMKRNRLLMKEWGFKMKQALKKIGSWFKAHPVIALVAGIIAVALLTWHIMKKAAMKAEKNAQKAANKARALMREDMAIYLNNAVLYSAKVNDLFKEWALILKNTLKFATEKFTFNLLKTPTEIQDLFFDIEATIFGVNIDIGKQKDLLKSLSGKQKPIMDKARSQIGSDIEALQNELAGIFESRGDWLGQIKFKDVASSIGNLFEFNTPSTGLVKGDFAGTRAAAIMKEIASLEEQRKNLIPEKLPETIKGVWDKLQTQIEIVKKNIESGQGHKGALKQKLKGLMSSAFSLFDILKGFADRSKALMKQKEDILKGEELKQTVLSSGSTVSAEGLNALVQQQVYERESEKLRIEEEKKQAALRREELLRKNYEEMKEERRKRQEWHERSFKTQDTFNRLAALLIPMMQNSGVTQ